MLCCQIVEVMAVQTPRAKWSVPMMGLFSPGRGRRRSNLMPRDFQYSIDSDRNYEPAVLCVQMAEDDGRGDGEADSLARLSRLKAAQTPHDSTSKVVDAEAAADSTHQVVEA